MPTLSQITIYPIKSLDGVCLNQVTILPSGALQHDREYAIFTENGKFVNGKQYPQIHLLASSFTEDLETVFLRIRGTEITQSFHLKTQIKLLELWLSDYFGFKVLIKQNNMAGFPDDNMASGPTIISESTVKTVASWFDNISINEMRSRFRTNLEITDTPPFWEDQLFGKEGENLPFYMGDIQFLGINPCQRCMVPTRNPLSGENYTEFQKIFVKKRQETLPEWTNKSRFNHYYKLSVNTCIPATESGKILSIWAKLIV